MMRVLFKRALRDLKHNAARYAALLLLIIISIFVVFGMVGAANTIIKQTATKDEEANLEDGQFAVFEALSDERIKELEASGLIIEKSFSVEYDANGGDILRMFKIRQKNNLILLISGELPETKREAVLERRYAEDNDLEVGDSIDIGGENFTICGIGTTPDYNSVLRNMSDTVVDSEIFGTVFVTDEGYESMLQIASGVMAEEYLYSYRLGEGITDEDVYDLLSGETIEYMGQNIPNLTEFIPVEKNLRVDTASDDIEINRSAGIVAGIMLVVLFSYVISVFIVHSIDSDSEIIGALYSMGVSRKNLTASYVMVPVIVTFLGGLIGSLIGIFTPLGIEYQMQNCLNYYSCPKMDIQIPAYLYFYGLVMPPLVACVVNVLVIRKRLKRTPLSLLRNEQKAIKGRDINLGKLSFINKFRIRQQLREIRSGLTVVFGLFISLLVAMLGIYVYIYCDSVRDETASTTRYEYMYSLKYAPDAVPEGGYEAMAEPLTKPFMKYDFDVTLLGVTEDNPFFDIDKLSEAPDEVIASSSFVEKYRLEKGDSFSISGKNDGKSYSFKIADVVDYTPSMMLFADIDTVREVFDEPAGNYNVVYSDHELKNIDQNMLYSTLTRDDIVKNGRVFFDQMTDLIILLCSMSAAIFATVLYLMMKTMLDRSSFNIALVKIFGFRDKEIKKMYLDGNFVIIVGGVLLSLPITKLILDFIYPRFMVANVGIGLIPRFSPGLYLMIMAIVTILYLIINKALLGRIRRAVPAQVLKNRE